MKNSHIKFKPLTMLSLGFLSLAIPNLCSQLVSAAPSYSVVSGSSISTTNRAEASGDGATVQADIPLYLTIPKSVALAVAPNGSSNSPGGLFDTTLIPASTLNVTKRFDELKLAGSGTSNSEFTINGAVATNITTANLLIPATVSMTNSNGAFTIDMSGTLQGGAAITVGGSGTDLSDITTYSGHQLFELSGNVDVSTVTAEDRAGDYTGTLTIVASII